MTLNIQYFKELSVPPKLNVADKIDVKSLDIEIKHLHYLSDGSQVIQSKGPSFVVSEDRTVIWVPVGEKGLYTPIDESTCYNIKEFVKLGNVCSNGTNLVAVGLPSVNQVFIYKIVVNASVISKCDVKCVLVAIVSSDNIINGSTDKSNQRKNFGRSLAVSKNGNTLIVGSDDISKVDILDIKYAKKGDLVITNSVLNTTIDDFGDASYVDLDISINETGDNFIINKVGDSKLVEFSKVDSILKGDYSTNWVYVEQHHQLPGNILTTRSSDGAVRVTSYVDNSISIVYNYVTGSKISYYEDNLFSDLGGSLLIALSGDGHTLFVSSTGNNTIYVCELQTTSILKIIGKVNLDEGYGCVSLSSTHNGKGIWVECANYDNADKFGPNRLVNFIKLL